jgi:hypothetical protein
MSPPRRLVEELRRPAHTGRNRCWPCTLLNAFLVAAAATAAWRRNRTLGVSAAAVGCLLVYLRGYVVPGTPRFAPALVDPLPVEFGHGPDAGAGPDPDSTGSDSLAADSGADPEALLGALLEAGVVTADGEELYLEGSFRDDWEARMAELRGLSGEDLAARAAAAGDDVEGEYHDGRVLLAGDRDVWLRPAVAVAETAAVETLAGRGLEADLRAPAAGPLRSFLRTCPVCGGDVVETTLRNCCGGPGGLRGRPERPVLACEACNAVVAGFEGDPGGA